MKVKHAAIDGLKAKATFDGAFGVSLFGDAAWTELQEMQMRIVGHFEQSAKYPEPMKQRIRKRVVSDQLNPLLTGALAKVPATPPFDSFKSSVTRLCLEGLDKMDANFFHGFANCIEAAQSIRKEGPVHALHAAVLRLAEKVMFENNPTSTQAEIGQLPVTCRAFTERLNEGRVRNSYSEQHVRIVAAECGYSFERGKWERVSKSKT